MQRPLPDLDRLAYSAITGRPRLRWPDDARVALLLVPNVEFYEYLPPPNPLRDPWPRTPHPDVLGYGVRDYGNRVGLWRLFEVLDRHGIRATVSLNLSVFEHFPELLGECEQRGWDYMCHGLYNTRYLWGLPEEDEAAEIAECVATYRRLTGRPLAGWFSPAMSMTLRTPDLVAEAGIKYYCDYPCDDQPFPLKVRSGRLLSMPYTVDLNDAVVARQGHESDVFAAMIIDQFDTLYAEGAGSGRVMSIAVHPYLMGQPHRIRHLDEALAHICAHPGVWQATGEEIADWYYAHMWDAMQAHLAGESPHAR